MASENTFGSDLTPICSEMRGFIAQQSIFSHDSSLLFLYSGNTIYIHSVETGQCICSLKGHKSPIVSLIINPSNHLQLISMDRYGIIKIWDYLRCASIDTIDLSHIFETKKGAMYSSLTGCKPLTSSTTSIHKHLYIYCIVNRQHIISMHIKTKQITPIIYNVSRRRDVRGNKESFQNLSISNDGNYLSAIMQREIIIIKLTENTADLHLISYKTRGWQLSKCLAFHPQNELIAFGDQRGAIHLWHDFMSLFLHPSNWNVSFLQNTSKQSSNSSTKTWKTINEWLQAFPSSSRGQSKQNTKSETKTLRNVSTKSEGTIEQKYLIKKIHWHSHKISTIGFTTDGAYMLSGGEESVLVLTQLETSRQQFLPRLGGPITCISVSPDEVKFAVCLKSNRIRIVDSINNKIMKTIEGIGICHQMKPIVDTYHQHFSYNPRNICFVLPSLPGTVQFYDLDKDKSRGILQLVQYPLISRMQQKHPDRYIAEFMQFNQDGTRLITVLKRTTRSILGSDQGNGDIKMEETENRVDLVTLQIWHYNVSNNEFVLNTRIDSPHHNNCIRGIVFHPNKNRFVSFAHNDHNFKIWDECHVTKYLKPKLNNKDSADIHKVLTTFGAKKHVSWKSLMTGYYHKDPVSAAKFSNDGTILLIAAGTMLTLWNASNLMLLKKMDQLSIVRSMDTFQHVPYLLTVNEGNDVIIWDLLQFKAYWSLKQTLNMKCILDVIIIPFKHKLTSSNSLFLVVCELIQDEESRKDRKHLVLCDMKQREIVHKWLLPKDLDIKRNCMIIQLHKANKQILKSMDAKSICSKDIDVVFITNNGPVRIPCLYTQWKHKQSLATDQYVDMDTSGDNNDAITKYLEKISGNHSIFQRIFGTEDIQSQPVQKEELEKQKQLTRSRLAKLTPSAYSKSNAVDDMFSGPAHTLPPMNQIFEQYMSYFVDPYKAEQNANTKLSKEDELNQRRIGNSNVILDEINTERNVEHENIQKYDIVMKEDIVKSIQDNDNDNESDEDDFEMDKNDFDALRSIIMSPINSYSSTKKSNNISKKTKTKESGILSSFWNLRNGLNNNGINGSYNNINSGSNGLHSFKMNGLQHGWK